MNAGHILEGIGATISRHLDDATYTYFTWAYVTDDVALVKIIKTDVTASASPPHVEEER